MSSSLATHDPVSSRRSLDTFKGQCDLKEYRLIELHNGLRALLISTRPLLAQHNAEESSVKASAALAMQTGSFSDPDSLAGCAHFLEVCVCVCLIVLLCCPRLCQCSPVCWVLECCCLSFIMIIFDLIKLCVVSAHGIHGIGQVPR
jgi:hypothetical protein